MTGVLNLLEGTTPETPSTNYWKVYPKTDGLYILDDTGAEIKIVDAKDAEDKAMLIENPSASEDLTFFDTNVAITISRMRAVMTGSSTPSVTWTIRHSNDRDAVGNEVVTGGTTSTSITTGEDITSFNDETIPADSKIWVETTAQSGTVVSINITLFYDED